MFSYPDNYNINLDGLYTEQKRLVVCFAYSVSHTLMCYMFKNNKFEFKHHDFVDRLIDYDDRLSDSQHSCCGSHLNRLHGVTKSGITL